MFRPHVIAAIASRNIKTFFTNVTGYLFIVCFVVVSGFIAFGPKFFADNLATLDQLTNAYPLLLMFLIPAFTMGIWADERRQGTDAILFTLPASDAEILFGKFCSVVVVYVAALFFSLAQLIALASIGTPDWGVIVSTYIGYFLAGVSLLSIGMFASSLTANTTVAFVLGAVLCAIPVFIGDVSPANQFLQSLSVEWQLREFGQGSVNLSNVLYFLSLTVLGLFLNYVAITRRHWSSDQESTLFGLYAAQVVSILVIAGSFYYLSVKAGNYYDTEIDMTTQRINTLSRISLDTIREAAAKRKVYIQAYVSEQVPTEYVPVKKRLLRLLRQYERMGGENIELRIVNIKPNSPFEKEAVNAGIKKIDHVSEVGGRQIRQNVLLGIKFSSSIGEAVIPFVDVDTPLEYELTRALGTTGVRQKKLRLGVLDSHAAFLGLQIPMSPVSYEFNHVIVDRLKQRYELVRVSESDLNRMVDDLRRQKKSKNPEDGGEESKTDDKKTDSGTGKNKKEPSEEADGSGGDDEKQDDEKKNETKDETASDENAEPESVINMPDVLLVVRPSRIDPSVQEQIVEYMSHGKSTIILVDPLTIFPFTVFNGDGTIPESPKQKVVADQGGLFIVDEENNDCSTLFDALQIDWLGQKQQVTFPEVPGRPSPFGGPPQGGRPERTVDCFFPMFISQTYRPFEELRFDDLILQYRIGDDVRETGLNPSDERDGIPVSLGSPNALMINSMKQEKNDPFNRQSGMTSGINNVLMFYAGGIRHRKNVKTPDEEKDESLATEDEATDSDKDPIVSVDFQPLIKPADDAIFVSWDDVTKVEKRPAQGFPPREQEVTRIDPDPNFYAFELELEELESQIANAEKDGDANTLEKLKSRKEQMLAERKRFQVSDVCLAAHLTGKTKKGTVFHSVVITDSDFVSNLYAAIESVLNHSPDNTEFLLNVVDTLGGREDFVALRSRTPKQYTLTYMDRKREEFARSRLAKEQEMRREMRKKINRITEDIENETKQSGASGLERFFLEAEGAMKAEERIQIEARKLRNELDEAVAALKAEEARNLEEAESFVRVLAIILPCLPALILGIVVFLYRFVQERSDVNESRRA